LPSEQTTGFFLATFRTSSKISCEGATAPPGESMRISRALMEESSAKRRSCFMVRSASTPPRPSPMAPFTSTTPMRGRC